MKFIGIIPARYASTRFPGKPLALIEGIPMIERVYKQVYALLDDVFVATDNQQIFDTVKGFGGKVVMTNENHQSGTDRCYEAYTKIGKDYDVVVNIQGDEPFIQESQIALLKQCFNDASTQIATLVKPFNKEDDISSLENPNSPKVIINPDFQAIYFSRSVIPFLRGIDKNDWLKKFTFYKHLGLYAYKSEVLAEITRLSQSTLEIAESLEQLRWIENGYKIKVGITDVETIGIDTPEDLQKASEFFLNQFKK